jgi:hypothetical protein
VNTPLSDLLHAAVDDIEPADRIDAIRARTASSPARAARPWLYAAGGVVLATAATVAAFAVVDVSSEPAHDDHGAMAGPTGTQVVPAYFIGDTPRGPRLFREFDEVAGDDALQAALDRIERPATDPDYRTPWTATSFGSAMLMDGVVHVELGDAVLDDELAVQQVVYTLQGAMQERLPVQLGDTTFEALPQSGVLNPMSISDPAEGLEVHDAFTARGVANSFEANVPWELRDERGDVVKQGFATASGYGDHLYPWEARIDVRGLPFGFYTFVAMTDDPSGGAEDSGPDSDTRTIIVR